MTAATKKANGATEQADTRNIYQRMLAVATEIGVLEKEKKANGLQYPFTSYDAVAHAVGVACRNNGVLPVSRMVDWQQNGNTTEMQVVVTYYNADKPEEFIEVPGLGFGVDKQDKGPGKAASYATKQAHLKAFTIPCGLDIEDDTQEREPEPPKPTRKELGTAIKEKCADLEIPFDDLMTRVRAHWNQDPKNLTVDQLLDVLDNMETKYATSTATEEITF